MSLTGMLKGTTKDCLKLQKIINSFKFNRENFSYNKDSNKIVCKYVLFDWEDAGEVGTALDYLCRIKLHKHQQKFKNKRYKLEPLVAKQGLRVYSGSFIDEALYRKTEGYYIQATKLIEEYVNSDNEELFNRIVKVTVFLAKLEKFYRQGYKRVYEEALEYQPKKDVIFELTQQVIQFEKDFIDNFKIDTEEVNISFNPTFDKCSLAVGGADADIIIGNTLVDFKSSKYMNHKNCSENLRQLIAYYLFSKICNKGYSVDSITLYYSRYGKLITYTFDEKDKEQIEDIIIDLSNFVNRRVKGLQEYTWLSTI